MGLQKVVVILGPTASGKTDLALKLAREFNGEIISADSRQLYTRMSIATAKPEGDWKNFEGKKRYLVEGIPHYLVDIVDPGKNFSMAEFKKLAEEAIIDIQKRNKVPFIVGGTGLYIWSIVDNLNIPPKGPIKKLRKSFENKSVDELVGLLKTVDEEALKIVDLKNKRRIIRALEVAITTGESFIKQRTALEGSYDLLQMGIKWPIEELYERIEKRVDVQWQNGLEKEVENLLGMKYSFDLPSMSGIGYKQVGAYLHGEVTKKEAINWMKKDTRRYAKRQITWFKRDKRINWINKNDLDEARKLVSEFLNKKTA